MEIEGYNFPDDIYYHKEHYWAKVEGNKVIIGTSDFAQKLAGQVVYVELPSVGRVVEQGKPCGSMESGKWVGRVKAPIGGKILEANSELEWESGIVNSDPYGKGWLTKIEAADLKELEFLFRSNSPDLAKLIAEEKIKFKK